MVSFRCWLPGLLLLAGLLVGCSGEPPKPPAGSEDSATSLDIQVEEPSAEPAAKKD